MFLTALPLRHEAVDRARRNNVSWLVVESYIIIFKYIIMYLKFPQKVGRGGMHLPNVNLKSILVRFKRWVYELVGSKQNAQWRAPYYTPIIAETEF